METTTIVFSKNRACQLDLFLHSYFKNFDIGTVNVVVKTTDSKYAQGYEKLQKHYPGVNLIAETKTVREHFFDLMHDGAVCLSTDDTVFFRKAKFNSNDLDWILDEQTITFHPRLSPSCIVQDYKTGRFQKTIPNWRNQNGILKWEYEKGPTQNNWYYVFELDGQICRCEDLLKISQFEWQTLRSLEGSLANVRRNSMYYKSLMASPAEQLCVNIPANSVQDDLLYHSDKCHISEEELNNRWLDGEELSLDKMDFSNVIGCHAEIELKWK